MEARELLQTLIAAGWKCRPKGRDEVALETCYYCGNDRYNLELSATLGVFHCWACSKGGRLDGLLRELTGREHHIVIAPWDAHKKARAQQQSSVAAFKNSPVAAIYTAQHYLQTVRGIPATTATAYGLVVCTDEQHRLYGRIAIPMLDFWTGEVRGWIGRSYTGQVPKYLSTLAEKVITGWRQKDRAAPVVIVEGHFDGIAVHQAGYHAAILSGVGRKGIVDWASRIQSTADVFVMLDGSAEAQARQLYWSILPVRMGSAGKTQVLVLPDKQADPSSLGPGGVRALVQQVLSGSPPT